MCGRYSIYTNSHNLSAFYSAKIMGLLPPPTYNASPGAQHPVLVNFSHSKLLLPMSWGLTPSWSTDSRFSSHLINTRVESIFTKPTFRRLIIKNRCLIPANGYFEWDSAKNPYFFHSSDQPIISLAGLYDVWESPDGSPVFSYSIITTPSPKEFESIHPRSPLTISKSKIGDWLSGFINQSSLNQFQFSSSSQLTHHPVSNLINSSQSEGSQLIDPVNHLL